MVRNRLKTSYSLKLFYVDNIRRDLELEIGNYVSLKISPMNGVIRFCKKGKQSPQYVGPYEVLQWVRKVGYEFKLPSELASVHPVFHMFILTVYSTN